MRWSSRRTPYGTDSHDLLKWINWQELRQALAEEQTPRSLAWRYAQIVKPDRALCQRRSISVCKGSTEAATEKDCPFQ